MTPEEIKLLRESFRMTQAEFGQLMNVHWTTVSGWERGVHPVSPYHQQMLWQFQRAAKDKQTRDTLKGVLIGFGALAALAVLLDDLKPRRRR
jgi:DNA-binding XRE family transcriptional regulator